MIPFFRSLEELMMITQSKYKDKLKDGERDFLSTSKVYIKKENDLESKENRFINLPKVPKIKRRKWIKGKQAVSSFFDELDYNNQIQSSYELTLLERQSNYDIKDIA